MIIDTILGRPSQLERELCAALAEKSRQRDELLNDPRLDDPREASDPAVHSTVCRKRSILYRLNGEWTNLRLELGDERSRARNERTFYLLVALVVYLVVQSVIPLDTLAAAIKAFLRAG